jgi:hypothetical protein
MVPHRMARPTRPAAQPDVQPSPVQVKKQGFISYAHEDHDLFIAFQPYMKAIQRGFPWVEMRADPSLRPGKVWEDEIRTMIREAEMFVLLVSPAFIASDFIMDTELPEMRRRRREVGGLLLPVVLKPCLWKIVCEAVQAVPRDRGKLRPIEEWDTQSHGAATLDRVAEQLDALEAAKTEPSSIRQAPRLIEFYIGAMRMQIDMAQLQLKIGERSIDFSALSRASQTMTDLTSDFFATVSAWADRMAAGVNATIRSTHRAVSQVSRGMAKAIGTILRRGADRTRQAEEPRFIGPYRIQYQLGVGELNTVYAAVDTRTLREVALKVPLPGLIDEPGIRDRARSEARILALLDHPNIPACYGFYDEADTSCFALELIEGVTLRDILHRKFRLGIMESLAIMAQVGQGLGYAHRRGVIHNAIKPGNLMLTESGQIKIMNFGASRTFDERNVVYDAGVQRGVPAYMAPETIRGSAGSAQSDLYALACVLYEMLSGGVPFSGETTQDIFHGHLELPPGSLLRKVPDMDPKIDAAIERALAKDPAARFANVEEFSRAVGAEAFETRSAEIIRRSVLSRIQTR